MKEKFKSLKFYTLKSLCPIGSRRITVIISEKILLWRKKKKEKKNKNYPIPRNKKRKFTMIEIYLIIKLITSFK